MSRLATGDYFVQAVLKTNTDLKGLVEAGNLYSDVKLVHLDPASAATAATIRLELTQRVPAEALPADSHFVKYVKLESKLLSAFHARPISLRAGVILQRGYGDDPARKYPLRVHIGGYGARYTGVGGMMRAGSEFRKAWEAPDAPAMILLMLDGDGPLGDPIRSTRRTTVRMGTRSRRS